MSVRIQLKLASEHRSISKHAPTLYRPIALIFTRIKGDDKVLRGEALCPVSVPIPVVASTPAYFTHMMTVHAK